MATLCHCHFYNLTSALDAHRMLHVGVFPKFSIFPDFFCTNFDIFLEMDYQSRQLAEDFFLREPVDARIRLVSPTLFPSVFYQIF